MTNTLKIAQKAKESSAALSTVTGEQKNAWLLKCAALLQKKTDFLFAANQKDINAAPDFGLSAAQIDRLTLNPVRIAEMADAMKAIADLEDPIGRVISSSVRPNGLDVQKIRVPLGVVFFIYESRPNVTTDAAAICVKSGNAVILRGGKESLNSNLAIRDILNEASETTGFCPNAVQLIETPDRSVVSELLALPQYITVAIPRGGESLIRAVTEQAKMPVIKHFAGNCHVFIDKSADSEIAERVLVNSKCQRLGVCNTAESLIVHKDVLVTLLPKLAAALKRNGVEIRGDERTLSVVLDAVPATEKDFRTEYLAPIISVKVVDSLDDAIRHINAHSDQHTESIITQDYSAARRFAAGIDSSAVMINASTRFNDGGCFGLGAEIGISTDKFHARGPCGLEELTSYKYVVYGNGQIRE